MMTEKLNPSLDQRKRALIVDDDPHWRMIIARILSQKNTNMQIDYSLSASEAIQKLTLGRSYDVVISDYMFNEQADGVDVWNMHQSLGNHNAFVLTSGFTMIDEVEVDIPFIPKQDLIKKLNNYIEESMTVKTTPAEEYLKLEQSTKLAMMTQFCIFVGVAVTIGHILYDISAKPITLGSHSRTQEVVSSPTSLKTSSNIQRSPAMQAGDRPLVQTRISRPEQIFTSAIQGKIAKANAMTDLIILEAKEQH